jgi:endonuclease-3
MTKGALRKRKDAAHRAQAALKAQARRIVRTLARLYPDARCSLDYQSPYQLLVATILSAQCTDVRVNLVTPAFFFRFPDAHALARAAQSEVESLIRSTGFYRNKAKNLIACAKALVAKHGGEAPGTLDELVPLPGVGRKTANVVLGNAFGVPGMVVDTHVARLARRLGLTRHENAEKIEQDLMTLVPAQEWVALGHRLIAHGRQVCIAQRPRCERCALAEFCPKVGVPAARGPGKA